MILAMKSAVGLLALVFGCTVVPAQTGSSSQSVTVPFALDHNRIVIDVNVTLPSGTSQRIHAWVDNGNPDLTLSRRLATLLGLNVTCDDKACSAPPPPAIDIGGMRISLSGIHDAEIPLKPVTAASVLVPGLFADINIPSPVLRNYDVLVDFPGRRFTLGVPGSLKFRGTSGKVLINSANGRIQVPSQIENKKYNLALDLGSSISFLIPDVFDMLAAAHPDWPHMTGAVGSANMWGLPDEPSWKVMRLDRLQYGPLFLVSVPAVDFPKDRMDWFVERAGVATGGLVGSEALLNYRIGLDYAHSTVYFEIGSTFKFPDFDVVGLVLRPEDDGRFTVLGVAAVDGQPSVPGVLPGDHLLAVDGIPIRGATMGQIWKTLGGTPGQERRLVLEHDGKQFGVVAQVQHFLGEAPESNTKKNKSKR
jgi:hypothetical protein